jgi:hypothetical protein
VRRLVLLALIACGDKPPDPPVAPTTTGSAPVTPVVPPDANVEASRIALRAGGKPPVKSTRPVAREQLTTLSALEMEGLTRSVRKLDEAFLDVEYTLVEPPITIGVTVQPCLRCLPMLVDRWRAEGDALRVTIPPDLRDRTDTQFEVTAITIGGAPAIATHQIAFVPGDRPIFDHAVAVYFADGTNQIRAKATYTGPAKQRDELTTVVTRRELEQLAIAVLDRYAQAW